MSEVIGPQTPSDYREYIKSIDENGNAVFQRVGVEELNYRGRFGATETSGTENTISIGDKYFTLDHDNENFRVGDDILITALPDPTSCFMWGEIIGVDTVDEPKRIRVFVDDVSNLSGTFSYWEVQVVARPKPGIEKDISLSEVEINPGTGKSIVFTVSENKFFPVGGQVLIKPTEDRTVALLGKISAYSGDTLTVVETATNLESVTTYSSWSIALLDAPIRYSQKYVDGLQIRKGDAAYSIIVEAGSIMDTTGSVLLTLQETNYKSLNDAWSSATGSAMYPVGAVVQVPLSGTIGSSGITVTGSSTAFLTDFDIHSTIPMDDYSIYSRNILSNQASTIYSGSEGRVIYDTNNNTDMDVTSSWTVSGGSSYGRNSLLAALPETETVTYFVYIIRNPSTGEVDISANNRTVSRAPDLPSGYTEWRLIASIECFHRGGSMDYFRLLQPHHAESVNITPAYMLDSTGLSVLGNSLATTQGPDWIVAGSPDTVLRRVGSSTLAFGKVSTDYMDNIAAYSIIGNTASSSTEPTAFKISDLTEKASPTDTDYLLINDTASSYALKKIQIGNLPSSGGGGGGFPADFGLVTDVTASTFDLGDLT